VRIVPADIDGDGVRDLVSLGQNVDDPMDFRLWGIPMQGEASVRLAKSSTSGTLKQGFDWNHVLIGALDLDGMPGDELALLGPRLGSSGYQSAIAHASIPTDPNEGKSLTYTVGAPSQISQAFTRTEQPLTDPTMHNGRMRIADVDADGNDDVVALGQTGKNGTLVVFFNDKQGELGTPTSVNGAEKLDVRDFALAGTAADGKPRIVVLTTTGIYIVTVRGRELTVGSTPALSMSAGAPTSPSLISAGDIDGDGVLDLALGGPLGFEVHLGISANPLDAR
jgi:hypothetical protein